MYSLRLASFVIIFIVCSTQYNTTNLICDDGDYSCTTCFNMLVDKTITSSKNQYNMQRAFFPPDKAPPIYVKVHYFCRGKKATWFWSANTFYVLFNPLTVYQFTSLFFGEPSYLNATLELTLADKCCGILADEHNETMRLFTQRVRISFNDIKYKAPRSIINPQMICF